MKPARDIMQMSREDLLVLRNEVQVEVDTLRAKVALVKRTAAARGRYVTPEELGQQELAIRECGRRMEEIQTRVAQLKAANHTELVASRDKAAQPWTEIEKLTFDLWRQATAMQIATEGLATSARLARCLTEARAFLSARDANKLPDGFPSDSVEFWSGVVEGDVEVAPLGTAKR